MRAGRGEREKGLMGPDGSGRSMKAVGTGWSTEDCLWRSLHKVGDGKVAGRQDGQDDGMGGAQEAKGGLSWVGLQAECAQRGH